MLKVISKAAGVAAPLALATLFTITPASAELFDGCPSSPILGRFIEFGKSGKMPKDLGKWLNTPDAQKMKPWKPFDNVDYVGICWVSAWVVNTDDGGVLIDTLYGQFTKQLIENMKSSGIDFENIKYVLITHGHFDHAGGAAALKAVLPNAKFVMTQRGWDEATKSAANSKGRRAWKMIEPEIVAKDGDTFEVGGNTFRVYETPGHTWGTASYTYDVKDGDQTHRAITIGGLGLNAIDGPEQVEAYIDSVNRIGALTKAGGEMVEVHLTTHGFSNQLAEDRKKFEERKKGESNVFVNPEGLLKQVAALKDRAEKRLAIEKNK